MLNWKGPRTYSIPPNCSKDSWKVLPCLYLSIGQSWWFNELGFKRYIQKCTLSHVQKTNHDVTDLVNHGMIKKIETWISWEQNITFLQNKKILGLGLRWHILRSYCFVAEVTFKGRLSLDVFFYEKECFFPVICHEPGLIFFSSSLNIFKKCVNILMR